MKQSIDFDRHLGYLKFGIETLRHQEKNFLQVSLTASSFSSMPSEITRDQSHGNVDDWASRRGLFFSS